MIKHKNTWRNKASRHGAYFTTRPHTLLICIISLVALFITRKEQRLQTQNLPKNQFYNLGNDNSQLPFSDEWNFKFLFNYARSCEPQASHAVADSSSKTVGETEMALFNFSHEIPAKINWRCIHDKIYIDKRSSRVSKDDAGAGNNFGHEKTIRTYKFLNDMKWSFFG